MYSQQNAHNDEHGGQKAPKHQLTKPTREHSDHWMHHNSHKHSASSLGCLAGLQDSMQDKQETLRHRLGRRMLLAESSLAAAWQL
jgi:hypothetical protein